MALAPLQVRQRDTGRAHARRSWCVRLCIVKVAIVPVGELARTRTGGVSPSWLHERDCNGVRERTGDSLPKSAASAFASASPESTAGSRSPLLVIGAAIVCECVRIVLAGAVPESTAG